MSQRTLRSKRARRTVADDAAPAGSQACYEAHLPAARKIPAAEVRPMRADLALALTNAHVGVDAVLGYVAQLKKELPRVAVVAIATLPDVGLGLAFAAGQVARYAPPPSGVQGWLKRAHQLRAVMLSSADALAAAGVLPAAALAKIHAGHGGIDTAGDCVALAALFQQHAAAIRGKTPVTAAHVREAAEVGTRLLAVLQPKGAKRKGGTSELKAATESRDRLWTLFERTWEDQVWRAGAWLFRRAVDQHVPPLQSRVGHKRPAKAAPPTPAAAAGGAPW
ncbi:MAG: hypothetical protein HY906_09160 [Deltaproteobacteria bacterium]|nr:hypothetical protein [Deltaproteobacteria bacterium]